MEDHALTNSNQRSSRERDIGGVVDSLHEEYADMNRSKSNREGMEKTDEGFATVPQPTARRVSITTGTIMDATISSVRPTRPRTRLTSATHRSTRRKGKPVVLQGQGAHRCRQQGKRSTLGGDHCGQRGRHAYAARLTARRGTHNLGRCGRSRTGREVRSVRPHLPNA
jgi:hypothetical protein